MQYKYQNDVNKVHHKVKYIKQCIIYNIITRKIRRVKNK